MEPVAIIDLAIDIRRVADGLRRVPADAQAFAVLAKPIADLLQALQQHSVRVGEALDADLVPQKLRARLTVVPRPDNAA